MAPMHRKCNKGGYFTLCSEKETIKFRLTHEKSGRRKGPVFIGATGIRRGTTTFQRRSGKRQNARENHCESEPRISGRINSDSRGEKKKT